MKLVKIIGLSALWLTATVYAGEKDANFDFDHKVHYKQTQLSAGKYYLEVLNQDKTRFTQMSAFLLRHAHKVCKGYDFNLQLLKGIEQFDDKRVSPNYIHPALTANLECANK